MVRKAKRSRSLRRIIKRTPGGISVRRHVERQPKKAHCANCKGLLSGVARNRPIRMQNMAKSRKRPERPYAGMLCSRCMRAEIKKMARSQGVADNNTPI